LGFKPGLERDTATHSGGNHLDQVWARNLAMTNVLVAEHPRKDTSDHLLIKTTIAMPVGPGSIAQEGQIPNKLTQGQIRALYKNEGVLKHLTTSPPDITSQALIDLLPKEAIRPTNPTGKRRVRLRYNKPKEVEHQPEELVISGTLHQHRLLDQLKEYHQSCNWKAFYATVERVLRVKASTPIVRTVLADEGVPVNDEEEVTAKIAQYFERVYALEEEMKGEEARDHPMEEPHPVDAGPLFTKEDVEQAVRDCNFNKGLGPDGFDGSLLTTSQDKKEEEVALASALQDHILRMLNEA
jgi:hypothetical protein